MRIALVAGMVAVLWSSSAAAQSAEWPRIYAGGTLSIDGGQHGKATMISSLPAGGGIVGLQFNRAWGLEGELDRGVAEKDGTSEGVAFAFGLGPNATREEIEAVGVRARWDRTHSAGSGFAVHATWRTNKPGRLNAMLLLGVAARHFTLTTHRTITLVPENANVPPTQSLGPETQVREQTGGGISTGVVFPVALTGGLSLAPEFRYTLGLMGDSPYRPLRAGVRMLWTF